MKEEQLTFSVWIYSLQRTVLCITLVLVLPLWLGNAGLCTPSTNSGNSTGEEPGSVGVCLM